MEDVVYVVFVVVAAVVVFAVAAAAVGRGDGLEESYPDLDRPYLPEGPVEPADIDGVHFAVAFRGYRMDQVDSVLDRLSEEIHQRNQRIAVLERAVHMQTASAHNPTLAYRRDDGTTADVQPPHDVPGMDEPRSDWPGQASGPPPYRENDDTTPW